MRGITLYWLVRHRDCLVPTWRGWLLMFSILTVLFVFTVRELYPFMAVTEPVTSGLLVVEGWVSDTTMEATIAEFKRHHYDRVFVTGGPIEHITWMNHYKTYAEGGAAALLNLGLKANEVQAVPSTWVRKDRTYTSAVALRNWMQDRNATFTTVHLITEGAHARRSRLMFQRALGSSVTVGVTSVPDSEYDPEHWWQSSAGVKAVVGEVLAYGYACFLL
jgi:uncharacterized SAM-binding protein YcdF (DUF218 family)